jgi:FkbM family methyltransferase
LRWAPITPTLIEQDVTPLIIDPGANIGASTLWFASNFPGSHVVAIEPEKNNCELLRRNCRGLNYELLEGAISSREGYGFLHDPGRGEWAYQVRLSGSGYRVPLYSAADIVAEVRENFAVSACALGVTPVWLLVVMLWMPWINTAKSYRAMFEDRTSSWRHQERHRLFARQPVKTALETGG